MIIPIKCFTCGNVLADKYRLYRTLVAEKYGSKAAFAAGVSEDKVKYLTKNGSKEKTADGIVLDELGLHKLCCRRHMLTHVDIE